MTKIRITAVGTGLSLGGGASIAEMRNEHGVTIQLDSTTEGLSVSLAAKGVEVSTPIETPGARRLELTATER